MRRRSRPGMIVLVPGLAIPEYMGFLLEYCEPIGYTRRAVEAGDLLRVACSYGAGTWRGWSRRREGEG